MNPRLLFAALVLAGFASPSRAQIDVAIDVARPGASINPAMWGLFFEDINFGADGGLYAELVKNRGFEFPEPLMGWSLLRPSNSRGEISVRTDAPFNPKNAHYVRIESSRTGPVGVGNEGFRGMGLRAGATYDFSLRVRRVAGAPKLVARLYGEDGTVLASAELNELADAWTLRTATLRPAETSARGRLALLVEGGGTVDVDFVSLFPRDTWRGRPGGLRADMVAALAELKPGFLRFPGGCIVEGSELAVRYQWKNTLGPVEERPVLVNRWNYEFLHRPAPDYYQSFGLGFLEYFQLCEDIGAQPLPIVNCGMACQFNSGELCALEDLGPYIQDALDLVEFANGPVTSEWGAKRAALGHPEPFNLRMLGIGNEQWGQAYVDRYARFAEALRARHPEITLIASSGPFPADANFTFAWAKLRELRAEIIDEHVYARPAWFLENARRYDRYDRRGPKVLMGEFAAQTVDTLSTKNRNNLEGAIAEAAFLTGLERNADVVRLASAAPLFGHVDAWQWTPNLLWVDNLRLLKTPNYHAQALFSRNRGDRVLPLTQTVADGADASRLYVSAVRDDATGEVVVKLVNASGVAMAPMLALRGVSAVEGGLRTVLAADTPDAENSFEHPGRVAPRSDPLPAGAASFAAELAPHSVTILRLRVTEPR